MDDILTSLDGLEKQGRTLAEIYNKKTEEGVTIGELTETLVKTMGDTLDAINRAVQAAGASYDSIPWAGIRDALDRAEKNIPVWVRIGQELLLVEPLVIKLLSDPVYEGKTLDDLLAEDIDDQGEVIPGSFLEGLLEETRAARAEKRRQKTAELRKEMQEERRRAEAKAREKGAIMELKDGLPVFSEKSLWPAFSPGRIAKMGTLSRDVINEETGRVEQRFFSDGELLDLHAKDIPYNTLQLLSAIRMNSVGDFRERFEDDGKITFYVKGVLDFLKIDPRSQPGQGRKSAGAVYLENQFRPLQEYIGLLPSGSRYSVLSYVGYDADTDTMTICTPYIYELWRIAQGRYSDRQESIKARLEQGKKPLKKDFVPLEVNYTKRGSAYQEPDATVEIADYITNLMFQAGGKGKKTLEVLYTTIIKECPRIRERLEDIEEGQKTNPHGEINWTARYNAELRRIARACALILDEDKSNALKTFNIKRFELRTDKGAESIIGKQKFPPPTKSTLRMGGRVHIEWTRIDE